MSNALEMRRALSDFVEDGARAQPPVFVGRGAVIADIETAARRAHDKWLSGEVDAGCGLTRLVQGAPGAGKSALLRRLEERWRGGPAPGCAFAVRLAASALAAPDGMRKHLQAPVPQAAMKK